MLHNYLRSAWRMLKAAKENSILHLFGLTMGMSAVLLIALYINDEYSFDRSFHGSSHIYQVNLDANYGGQAYKSSGTPPPVGAALKDNFPEVLDYTRTHALGNEIVSKGTLHFTEKRIFGADSNFLQVFDYPMLMGNPSDCLLSPHSIVLSEAMAQKYFGSAADAMGQRLMLDGYNVPFVVKGILKNPPEQVSFQFDMLISMADCSSVRRFSWSWIWQQMTTYVVVSPKINNAASVSELESKFPAMVKVQAAGAFARIGQPLDQFLNKGGKWNFFLQPLTRVHLYSAGIGTSYTNLGDITYIWIFAIVATFILLLACVNFMNLSTAMAMKRGKEVGVRKVLGSGKGQLIRQFLSESLLLSFIAMGMAIVTVGVLLPGFNTITAKSLTFSDLFKAPVWLLLWTLPLLTGLLAGWYPALFLSRYRPVIVLKGIGYTGHSSSLQLRNGLVVFQFATSITLVICTLVVLEQLNFERSKDLGFQKAQVLVLSHAEKMPPASLEALRQDLQQVPGVRSATISSDVPGINYYGFTDFYSPSQEAKPLTKDLTLSSFVVDPSFIPTLHMQLVQGKNFDRSPADSMGVILNETAISQLGWKNPLGKHITYPGKDNQTFQIIGVVKDFHVQSLKEKVTPFALFSPSSGMFTGGTSYILLSLDRGDPGPALQKIARTWETYTPGVPYEYSFLDQDFDALYRSENRMGEVFGIFTGLSMAVASMGLLGLSIFTARRRRKEIAVRKVLGASEGSLLLLLTRDFMQLVLLASLVAFPLAGWAMHVWLQDFVYRITVSWWTYALSGLAAAGLALGTLSIQTVKTVRTNPIGSLKDQ
jgi:putative ABC transport system permease protein